MRAGILGATGAVGQTFIRLLQNHPQFEIAVLAASERSAGKKYREAANWIMPSDLPREIGNMEVQPCTPDALQDCDFVFSGLDAGAAETLEQEFANAGIPVISNARNHRMRSDVPLLIPEINPDHTVLIDRQNSPGFIVTNPNCAVVGLAVALRPLMDAFGIEDVHVVTLQATSGAGYPGVASLDILGNVVPFIGGEEAKVESEPLKILGKLEDRGIENATFSISAQCTRVPVIDGHMGCVSVRLSRPASPEEVSAAFQEWQSPLAGLNLPSAPDSLIRVYEDARFPQPRLHVMEQNGMQVSIGGIRECHQFGIKFVFLVHNTIRGAAGGAILNAELLAAQNRL